MTATAQESDSPKLQLSVEAGAMVDRAAGYVLHPAVSLDVDALESVVRAFLVRHGVDPTDPRIMAAWIEGAASMIELGQMHTAPQYVNLAFAYRVAVGACVASVSDEDSLRQRVAELVAENADLRRKRSGWLDALKQRAGL